MKTHRERIKQSTRQGILDASRSIARGSGWSALTIRKVAEAIEYSPSMIYEYFDGKEAILIALLLEGFEILASEAGLASSLTANPEERIRQLAASYVKFAGEYPELYELMHGFAGADLDANIRSKAASPIAQMVEVALINWSTSEKIILEDPRFDAEVIWSFLHGLVSLIGANRIKPQNSHAQHLLNRGLQVLLLGWKSNIK